MLNVAVLSCSQRDISLSVQPVQLLAVPPCHGVVHRFRGAFHSLPLVLRKGGIDHRGSCRGSQSSLPVAHQGIHNQNIPVALRQVDACNIGA